MGALPYIVQLTTYPIVRPRHGGQIRASQIAKALSSVAQVDTFSISEPSHEGYGPNDLIVNPSTLARYAPTPLAYDWATACYVAKEAAPLRFLKSRLRNRPDLILLEHPWLYPLLERLEEVPPIIYSSHNVEYRTKERILQAHAIHDHAIIASIKALEIALLRRAVLTATVSDEDKTTFLSLLSEAKIVVAPNGVEKQPIDYQKYDHICRATPRLKIALIVGSAYPPNAIGFWQMLTHLSYLPPDVVIVTVGGIGEILDAYRPESLRPFACHLQHKIIHVGKVDDAMLQALIARSDLMLLPITTGGGSNLKTAEALLSGKPIVATSFAFRGYESYRDLPGVLIADTPHEFAKALHRALVIPKRSALRDPDSLKSLHWTHTLKPLVRKISLLLQRSATF